MIFQRVHAHPILVHPQSTLSELSWINKRITTQNNRDPARHKQPAYQCHQWYISHMGNITFPCVRHHISELRYLFILWQNEPTVLVSFIWSGILYQMLGVLCMKLRDNWFVRLVPMWGSFLCLVLWSCMSLGVNMAWSGEGRCWFLLRNISLVVFNWYSLDICSIPRFSWIGPVDALYFDLVIFRTDLFRRVCNFVKSVLYVEPQSKSPYVKWGCIKV